MNYLDNADVALRLGHSIVRWKGRPAYVQSAGAGTQIVLSYIDDLGGKDTGDANDEYLDLTPVQLGWMNYPEKGPVYVARMPYKQQTQGLCAHQFNVYGTDGQQIPSPFGGFGGSLARLKPIVTFFTDEYPTFAQARARLRQGKGAAWDRRYCLAKINDVPVVFINDLAVGLYNLADNSVKLSPKWNLQSVRSTLEERMHIQ